MKARTTVATGEAPDGSPLVLQEHDGDFYLSVSGVPLMTTRAHVSEQQMADIACENIRQSPRVLIGGLGFGFTLKRVLELVSSDAEVEVAELVPDLVTWNRQHLAEINGQCLVDSRVVIQECDVFEMIRDGGSQIYDAILLDVDNSPDPLVQKDNGRLYTRSGLKAIKRSLRSGGRVVFWSAKRDKAFEELLAGTFVSADSISAKAYPQAKKFTHTLFVGDKG